MVLTFVVLSGKKAPAKLIARERAFLRKLVPYNRSRSKASKIEMFCPAVAFIALRKTSAIFKLLQCRPRNI
jgi:hypothetical protein